MPTWADCALAPALAHAHPLSEPFALPVSPIAAGYLAAGLVLVVALAVPAATAAAADGTATPPASWTGRLSRPQAVTRAVAVVVLGLAVAAGRLGVDDELENLAPALVVGAGWPLLVLASVVVGPVWRWVDPWDAIARPFAADQERPVPRHVWPAVGLALAWTWYLGVHSAPLSPRSVGTALAAYTIVTVAGCLAAGRARWLAMGEPLGIVLSWMALLPRRRLTDWRPPRGAEALLGVLLGGVLFGALRRSEVWGGLNTASGARLLATGGLLAACALAVGLLFLVRSLLEEPDRAAVARAAVPAVAGAIVAVALDRNRLFTSVQLLPGLLGDPFGGGWDLLGRPDARLDPAPLGVRGLVAAQLGVLVAGGVVGAAVAARGVRRRSRLRLGAGLAASTAASILAVVTH